MVISSPLPSVFPAHANDALKTVGELVGQGFINITVSINN